MVIPSEDRRQAINTAGTLTMAHASRSAGQASHTDPKSGNDAKRAVGCQSTLLVFWHNHPTLGSKCKNKYRSDD
jgi:hypothetical protein